MRVMQIESSRPAVTATCVKRCRPAHGVKKEYAFMFGGLPR